MAETNFEDAVGKFVKNAEGVQDTPADEKKSPKAERKETVADKFAREARELAANRPTLREEQQQRIDEIKAEQRAIGMGFMEIPLKDLPVV